MSFSPITIANFFLLEYDYKPSFDIHKLVYLAHGWYMDLEGKELVDEEPEAWADGPVFPSLHSAIQKSQSPSNKKKSVLLDSQDLTLFNEADRFFFRAIHTRFGILSENKLSELTNNEGSPWHQMVHQYVEEKKDIPQGIIIKNDLIRAQFKGLTETR